MNELSHAMKIFIFAVLIFVCLDVVGDEKMIDAKEALELGISIESVYKTSDNKSNCSDFLLVAKVKPNGVRQKEFRFEKARLRLTKNDEGKIYYDLPLGGWYGHGKFHSKSCINSSSEFIISLQVYYRTKGDDSISYRLKNINELLKN
ncbi:hypothetical protein TDB9533_03164 [Thalassocella blandensis]|nr:hypothetical protein TDB9533_03164 [Thalassocella blandensis]